MLSDRKQNWKSLKKTKESKIMDLDQVKSYNEDVAAQRAKRDADYEEYEKAGRIGGWFQENGLRRLHFHE